MKGVHRIGEGAEGDFSGDRCVCAGKQKGKTWKETILGDMGIMIIM